MEKRLGLCFKGFKFYVVCVLVVRDGEGTEHVVNMDFHQEIRVLQRGLIKSYIGLFSVSGVPK